MCDRDHEPFAQCGDVKMVVCDDAPSGGVCFSAGFLASLGEK